MKVKRPKKWIDAKADRDRTSDVAVRTLKNRFGTVLRLLPLAAGKAGKAGEDIEHIHQLRVGTRRAAAALGLYGELIPRRRFSWMQKQLKRLRRAAGDARDCDVLIERLRKQRSGCVTKRWLEELRAERVEAQKVVVAVHRWLGRGDRFAGRIDELLERVRSRGEDEDRTATTRFGDWARQRLRPVVEQFFGAVPADRTDEAALHRFRIRSKELRYAMELLAGAFPDEFRSRLYPTLETMQERLGTINDLATLKARLQRKLEAAASPAEKVAWRRLLSSEQARFDQARQTFWAWWTPRMLRKIRDGFDSLLGHPTPPAKNRKPGK